MALPMKRKVPEEYRSQVSILHIHHSVLEWSAVLVLLFFRRMKSITANIENPLQNLPPPMKIAFLKTKLCQRCWFPPPQLFQLSNVTVYYVCFFSLFFLSWYIFSLPLYSDFLKNCWCYVIFSHNFIFGKVTEEQGPKLERTRPTPDPEHFTAIADEKGRAERKAGSVKTPNFYCVNGTSFNFIVYYGK